MRDPKIFCVGLNKTGTSSLKTLLEDLGYRVGDQKMAEQMFDQWVVKDFAWLNEFCKTADAFQDAPFSFPFTFVYLDQAFQHSKFILTIRDSSDQWYSSMTQFHEMLKSIAHPEYPEHALKNVVRHVFGTSEDDPYNKNVLTRYYRWHNFMVKEYFRDRREDLLVLNVASRGSVRSICSFLRRKAPYNEFPHIRPGT